VQPAPPALSAVPALESHSSRAVRALRIVHPFPTLLNVAATAALALIADDGAPDVSVFARMLTVMLTAQCAIGVANDVFDRELDAATKPWKPIASGLVAPATAVVAALALVVAMVALASTLGARSLALAALGLACGLAYDAGLKRTPYSALPFMVAIPVLPLWVWVTLGEWRDALWWLLPLGALLGLALHVANTLPDLDDDREHGVRGLPHRLGRRRSVIVAWASYAFALALSVGLLPLLDYDGTVYAPAAVFGAACLAGGIAIYGVRRDDAALQAGFGIFGVGAAVLAAGWLAAVG
jgi:4-hydroxybenzoate polyprenyltransferase